MELAKMEKLKNYTEMSVSKKLKRSLDALPESFLTKNLLTKKILKEKVDRLSNCSTRNIVHKTKSNSVVNKDTGEVNERKGLPDTVNLYLNNSCNQFLICPICSRKRGEVIKAKYTDRIKREIDKYKYAYMITFTVENQDKFADGFDLLQESLRSFRRQGQKRGDSYSSGESAKIKSALLCSEVKEGKNSKQWHIHNHSIVFTDEKLDYSIYDELEKEKIIKMVKSMTGGKPNKMQLSSAAKETILFNGDRRPVSKLSKEWYSATGGTSLNIKVVPQKVETLPDGSKELIYYERNRDASGKFYSEKKYTRHEIIKYATKINELPENKLIELLVGKDKRRFLSVWGTMKNGDESEPDTVADNEETLKEDYLSAIVYNKITGQYKENEFSERDLKVIDELLAKRERLTEYRGNANRVRAFYNKLRDDLKTIVKIHGLGNEKKNLEIIYEVDSLRKAYKVYQEYLFRHTVDVPLLRNRRLNKKNMSRKQLFYFNIIEKELKFIKGNKCKKPK